MTLLLVITGMIAGAYIVLLAGAWFVCAVMLRGYFSDGAAQ